MIRLFFSISRRWERSGCLLRRKDCVEFRHVRNFPSRTSAHLQPGMRFLRHFGEKESEAEDHRRGNADGQGRCGDRTGRLRIRRRMRTDLLDESPRSLPEPCGDRTKRLCQHERQRSRRSRGTFSARHEKSGSFVFQFRTKGPRPRDAKRSFSLARTLARRMQPAVKESSRELRCDQVQPG